MSPERPRSGPHPLWIVVAGWCKATANNQSNSPPNSGIHTSQGPLLHPARDRIVPPAAAATQDGRVEHGGGATSSVTNATRAGRTPNSTNLNEEQTDNSRPQEDSGARRKGRKTKANIEVGLLNLNGRGNISADVSKWSAVNQLLREKQIGILAVQETHLSEEDVTSIHDLFGRRICMINSPDPVNPTATRGVAVILNRELVDTSAIKHTVIVPGRALLVSTKWHAGKSLTILNVYAPNATTENTTFWNTLERKLAAGQLRKPDVMMGDFNLVEEAHQEKHFV
ncbi:hypothetical protein FOMPIDRAFT_1128164 [Fomitopsis schrenkii]|uniref:Endonuclease/exonuclease/phosphatase domain-containing protein n=1 Tax=Fomitopsis schrenkii TaxID=2126942 RepID=S8E2D9_FOMSC|nr:hypothetical protein FOMPIDRAFT_1128164 [Fomitopsis schrenkii]